MQGKYIWTSFVFCWQTYFFKMCKNGFAEKTFTSFFFCNPATKIFKAHTTHTPPHNSHHTHILKMCVVAFHLFELASQFIIIHHQHAGSLANVPPSKSRFEAEVHLGWKANSRVVSVPRETDATRLQNLELDDLAKKTGLSFIPTVLLQTDKQADGLQREWPEPSQDADKNLGYAAQWFGFAGIALIAALIILVRALKRVRRLASDRG